MRAAIVAAAVLAIAPHLVSAQSDACKGAFTSILGNPGAACLNPAGLVPLFTQSGDKSIVPVVDNWISGFCSAALCSNDTLAAIVRNVTTGCKADLSGTGIPEKTDEVIQTLQEVYPGSRKILCLEDTSKGNERCPTQTLKNIETNFAGGTLSLNSLFTTFAKLINPDPSLEKAVLCTSCIKESYNIARKEIPGYLSQAGDVDKELSAKCGASFIDGKAPPSIKQTAGISANSKTGIATHRLSWDALSAGLIALFGVVGVVMFFA